MTARRPSDGTLAAFAAGRLDEGLALVVAAHLERDPVSRRRLQDLRPTMDRQRPATAH